MTPADCTPGTVYYLIIQGEPLACHYQGPLNVPDAHPAYVFYHAPYGRFHKVGKTAKVAATEAEADALCIEWHEGKIEDYQRLMKAQTLTEDA